MTMADEEYVNRIRDLQRYIPFLEHTIKRLKSETGKVRGAQISKLQSLLEILTDTKKKLKSDALRKCEEVILKLYEKVEKEPLSETMHKYMCRNPPDDKFPFGSHDCSSNLDSEVALSVARQKLSKQAANTLSARSTVISKEKVQNDGWDIFSDHNEFSNSDPPYSENWNAKQILNWPASVFNPHFPMDKQMRPSFLPQNPNWNKEQQLYSRRSEISPWQELKNPKFNVWFDKESNVTKDPASRRKLIDYSDTFEVDSFPILEDPKAIPAPRIIAKQDRMVKEYLEEQKKIQLLKTPTPPKFNKPSDSDPQDLLSCTPSSSDSSPLLFNEDMDLEKLEELKAKLCRKLEESKEKEEQQKVRKQFRVLAPKPKIMESVVKEQDNIFGNLLFSIDQQIVSKEEQKKPEKKVKISKNINKYVKSNNNEKYIKPNAKKDGKIVNKTDFKEKKEDSKYISKNSKHKEHDKSKEESKTKDKNAKIKYDSKNKDKDQKNKDKESKSKYPSKEKELKHKDHKENESKNKGYTKSKEFESKRKASSAKHSRSSKNKRKFSDTTKVYISRRTLLTKEEKQKTDKPKTDDKKSVDTTTIPNINIPLVDKIIKELKESIKEKKVDLPEKLVKNDDKISATGRLSDKYPHKRKPSIDKLDPTKPESPKDFPPKITSPKKTLTTEVHSTKLQDPRLRSAFPTVSPVELKSPPFAQYLPFPFPNFQNEPIVNKPPSIGPFSPLSGPFFGNRAPRDPFANNMGNMTPNDPCADNVIPMDPFAGNMTPIDPFSTNYDVDMRQLSSENNFNNQNDQFKPPDPFRPIQDQLRPQLDQIRPEMDQIKPGMDQYRPAMDKFRHGIDQLRSNKNHLHPNLEPSTNNPDMLRQNQDQYPPESNQYKPNQNQFRSNQDQFRLNQDQIRPGPDQFRSSPDHFAPNHFRHKQPDHFRSNPGQFRRHTDEFSSNEDQFRPTLTPRFPDQNAPSKNRAEFHQNQRQEQNFNPLSQMNPIGFYENEDQNQERISFYENEKHSEERVDNFPNRRSFRGRGKRENYCPNRGHFRNVQWVTPMIRDENHREDPKDERRKPSSRFPNKNGREDKDSRRFIFSEEKNDLRKSRFEESNNSEEKRPPPNEAKREDPRKKNPEETREEKPKIESAKLSSVKPTEEISLPLDMLYLLVTKPIVCKEYSFQNFRIPKIRKSEINEEKKEEVKNKNEEIISVEDEPKVEKIVEEPKDEVKQDFAKQEEQKVKTYASASTSKEVVENPKTEAGEKVDMFNTFMKNIFDTCDSSFLLQHLDKCGISTPQSKTKRIRRIIDSDSESEEIEIKREKEIAREEEYKEKVEVKIEDTSLPKEPEDKTPEMALPEEEEKLNKIVESVGERKNRRRKQVIYSSDSSPEKPLVVNDASLVIEKRNMRKSTKKIPKTKRKSALGLLQEDLRGMLISEGVLTATGKRMCRMMKEHQEQGLYNDLNEPKRKEKESITSEDDDVPLAKHKNPKSPKKNLKLDLKQLETAKKDDKKEENKVEEIKRPQRRLKSSPRVLLEKIKFPIVKSSTEDSSREGKEEKREEMPFVESEIPVEVKRKGRPKGKRGAKRGRKKVNPLSTESSSVSTIDSETTETETVESEINESETTEAETAETATENEEKTEKEKLVKQKKNSWVHGVIKKDKRKMKKFDRSTSSLSQYTEICDQMSIAGSINEDVNKDVNINENEDIEAELPSQPQNLEETREKTLEPIKEKEPVMTAFLEPDNISLREQLIEERLKKTEEIASIITPKRSTLQFVDQLKYKLQSGLKQLEEQQLEERQLKREHIEDLPIEIKNPPNVEYQTDEIFEEKEEITPLDFRLKICSTISLAENETQNTVIEENENTSKEDTIRIASTCSQAGVELSENEDSQKGSEEETIELPDEVKEEETHVSKEDIDISNIELSILSDAKQKGVLDTIQRLAAKLQTLKMPENSDNSSEVAQFEQVEIKEEETQEEELNDFQEKVINVGAIEVRIKNKEQNYICKVPNCSFTSLYKISFTKHCADVHTKITVLCEMCARENSFNCFTMTSLFVHLFDIHKSNAKIVTAPPSAKIRIRRISGDLLSKSTETDPLLEMSELVAEKSKSNPEPSQQQQQEMGFLQIKDLRTLTEKEEYNLQPNPQKTPTLTEIQKTSPTVKIMQPNLDVAKKIIPIKKIMIPFHELSKCVNIKHTYQKKPIATWYKPKKIFNEMLTFPKILDIYKCPIEFCSFSTGAQKEFKNHMISHKWCQITVCVYCGEGIGSNNLITHIDTIHSHCSLQCALCFYRTISKPYLIDHQKTVHKHNFETLVKGFYYEITPINKTSFLYEIPSRCLMIFPYQCVQGNCTQKFLTSDDFMVHLHVCHKKYFMCAYCDDRTVCFVTAQTLIQHYVEHNIARYQCQYCVCGTLDMDAMFTHYATKHHHLEPICYVRQFKKSANTSLKTIDDFILINMDSKETIEPVKTIPQTPEKTKIEQTSSTITTLPEDQHVSSSNKEKPVETEENAKIIDIVLESKPKNTKVINVKLDKDVETAKIFNIDLDKDPENSKIVDIIDLNEENPHFNEPYVILKQQNIESKNVVENAVDPLFVDNFKKLNDTIEIEEVTDLSDFELYKCGTKNCTFRTSSLSNFKSHLFICDIFYRSYNCVHCDTKFASVIDLCEHIQIHGEKRFTCGVCDYKSSLGQQIVKHMKDLHKITTTKFHPIDPLKRDMARDHFMVESINKDKEMKKEREKEKSVLKIKLDEQSENNLKLIPIPTLTNLFGPESSMQNQSEKRFTCEICKYQSCLGQDIVTHMKYLHQVHYTQFHPIDPQRKDLSRDHFYVKAILKKSSELKEDDNKIKNIFGPEDIDSLSRPTVYSSEVKCKLCNYNTKVRSKMQRHLQQHIDEKAVSETAPVPYLEKNEKMFDKITNLAASSYYARMGGKAAEKSDKGNKENDKIYPGFVAVNKRFVCGAQNCNYLTLGDQMLRHHLTALHADEIIYKCPHCQIDIPADINGLDIDQTLFHLKMHDLHLYKCPNCLFIHYQKHKIERHISDNHSDEKNKNIVVIRELDNSANHDDDSRAAMPVSFREQIHAGFDGVPVIETVYYKITEEEQELEQASYSSQDDALEMSPLPQNFDTTPLWTKNKTGIKHIRGILLEKTKSSSPKRTPKIIEKLQEIKSNLGEGTSKSVDDITKNLFTAESEEEKITTPEKNEETDVETITKEIIPSTSNLHCKSCDFVAKNIRTFRKHQRKHYSHYPYKCNYCDFKTITVYSIAHHHGAKHKTEQVSYTEIPAPKTDEIAPESLKRKRSLVYENVDKNPVKILAKNEGSTDIITIEETEIEATNINEIEATEDENKQIFYSCLHCPRKSAELEKIRSHFFETHTGKSSGFKYKKVIMDKSKKLHYKCNFCDWFGDPTYLKRHCLKQHNDQTWVPQRNTKFKCSFCSQIYAKISQIRKHFNVKHPYENLTCYTLLEDGTILDKTEFFEEKQLLKCNYCSDHFENKTELQNHHTLLHSHLQFEEETSYVLNDEEELKKFKCPECGHTSNSFGAMKMHLRRHNRPFLCSHCSEYFFFRSHLKNHHVKLHGDLPLVINEAPEVKKHLDKLTETMLYLNDDGTYTTNNKLKRPNNSDLDEPPNKILLLDDELDTNVKGNVAKKSTSLPAFPKNVAQKSTANRPKSLEYSYYGTKPCDINNYKNVMSQINIMGKVLPINIVAMSHVLNLFPNVQVVDVMNQKKLKL